METAEFIETLRREGALLADAAKSAGLDAPVPPCPGWRVSDLVRHTGAVHRWAASFVAERRMTSGDFDESGPGEAELVDWYRNMHQRLVDALTAAPVDLACWHFLTAPSPLEFWARRQAHETTVHRVDAQAALGLEPSPMDPVFAANGVDELLTGFHARKRSGVRTDRPRTLRIRTVDVPAGDWLVHLSAEPPKTERGATGAADCEVSGPAVGLYLALWNRGPYEGLSVRGDGSLVELWQRTSAVT
jgi:uncharacterized protein (TIGR03083 family)